jgi:uncharacterized membrane protein
MLDAAALLAVRLLAVKQSILLALVVGALVVVAFPTRASAEFAVCNASTHGSVSIAYAATWQDGQGNLHGQSQGWFVVDQGKCTIIITTVDVSGYTLYLYGIAKDGSDSWGGDSDYCLDLNAKFLYQGSAMNTPCAAGKSYGMRLLTSGGASPYTYYLRD